MATSSRQLLRKAKAFLSVSLQRYPARVDCNLCGWRARVFASDAWHPHTICQRCGSQVRQRLLLAALQALPELSYAGIVRGKRILHFAPEPTVSGFLEEQASLYVSADLMIDGVDLNMDMCNMEPLVDSSFDLIVACDVLEHVSSDDLAMREIFRVLSPGGWAILTVPQKDHLLHKYEDPSLQSPRQRELAYGQSDHLRIYGDDFEDFVASYGFDVTAVSPSMFEAEMVRRHVLAPPRLSVHPLATNFRKVFFAHKA